MNDVIKVDDAGENNPQKPEPEIGARRDKTKGKRNPRSPEILSEEQCAGGLTQLPGLVMMNLITPSQSNAARAAFSDLLDFHRSNDRRHGEAAMADDDVLAIWRQRPELFRMIEKCLTDDQIAMVMKDAADGEEQDA